VFTTTGTTPISAFSKMKKALDREMLVRLQKMADERARALGEEPEPVTLERWTLHDIRRSGTTNLQALGVPIQVTEAILNHRSGEARTGAAASYHHYKFEPEKRSAMEAWGGYLARLIASAETGSNVIALADRAA
jgi:hypothetical protein